MRSVLSRVRLNWISALGILCIGLVLMSGMAQVAHFHTSGTIDHDCALCVAAHHVAHAAPLIMLDYSSRPVDSLPSAIRRPKPRSAVFFLYIHFQQGDEKIRVIEVFLPSPQVAVLTGLDANRVLVRIVSAIPALQLVIRTIKSQPGSKPLRVGLVVPKGK